MKKVLFLIVAAMLVLCSCNENSDVNEETSVVDWKNAYSEFLIGMHSHFESNDGYGASYIGLNDLNFDGVPELIVSDDGVSAAPTFAIYQIFDGKVQRVLGHTAAPELTSGDYLPDEGEDIEPYAYIGDGWLTLRKNKNTGEYKYVILTGNGSYNESFGSVYASIGNDEKGAVRFEEIFDYSLIYDDEGEIEEAKYKKSGADLTEEEYNKAREEFDAEWVDTGYVSALMGANEERYQKAVKMDKSAQGIKAFLDMYQPEPVK